MANPVGTEIVTVLPVQSNGQPSATTSQFTLNQLGLGPTIFGAGTNTLLESGNLTAQIGNPLAFPATITNDNVLAIYTLAASSLSSAGKGIEITAAGNLGNDSQAKRCKIIWNPSPAAVVGSAVATTAASFLLGDTGSTTNSGAACGWSIMSQVYKYGAPGSNTQIGQEISVIVGATHGGMGLASALTTAENASIQIAVTGNATSSVGDISLYAFTIEGFN